jgi:hypothetical protein
MVKKQDGCHNLAAILFSPLENRTKKSRFRMVRASLDRFINKIHKKYFIHAKMVLASKIRNPDTKSVRKMKSGRSGFGMLTVFQNYNPI